MKTKLIILSIAVLCFSAAPVRAGVIFGAGGGQSLQNILDNLTKDPTKMLVLNNDPGDQPAGSLELASGGAFNSYVNVAAGTDEVSPDALWKITAGSGSVNTLIIEVAAWAGNNTFGVYEAGQYVPIFAGVNPQGAQKTLSLQNLGDGLPSVLIDGADTGIDFLSLQFGYYLDSRGNILDLNGDGDGLDPGESYGGLWHSNTSLNADGMDHMAAYQGNDLDVLEIPTYWPALWADNEFMLAWEDIDNNSSWTDNDFTDFVVMVESVENIPLPGAVLLGILGLSVAGIKLRRFA